MCNINVKGLVLGILNRRRKLFFFTLTTVLFLSIVMILYHLTGCKIKRESEQKFGQFKLFHFLPPERTGIRFINQLHETDTFNALFYEYYFNGAGTAVGDINNDGLSDLFFGGNMEKSRLYLNEGDFKFRDITEASGIDTKGSWVTGISMVDINQDGWQDIYVCVGGNIADDYTNLLFINNGDKNHPGFVERAQEAGLADKGYSTQAAFFDYDLDGDLDMYLLTSSMNVPNKNSVRSQMDRSMARTVDRLYRNDGPDKETGLPHFTNVSKEAGIIREGFGLGIGISDINQDGWPDIYIANDYITDDVLYINQGDGTFKDEIKAYFKHLSYSAMGMDIADFNNDGLVDVFTLDMLPEDYFRKRIMAGNMRDYRRYMGEQMAGYTKQYIRNMLQLNNGEINGEHSFSEIGRLAGVFETDWSWAPLFADFDNDGYKDLFVGNGIPSDLTNMDFSALWLRTVKENPGMDFEVLQKILKKELAEKGHVKKPNVIFRNRGDLTFENVSKTWGMTRPSYSTSTSLADLDNDGDLDLILNNIDDPASVYENTKIRKDNPDSLSHYISLILRGSEFNRGGIGTKVILYYGEKQQFYEHYRVRGFQSTMDSKIHFGLGDVISVDSLLVVWPDRKFQVLRRVAADSTLIIKYRDALNRSYFLKGQQNKPYLFREIAAEKNIEYQHRERQFIDFRIQPLIPHKYSKEGPGIAVGDVNGDGLDDFFIGGSSGFPGALFIQKHNGKFSSRPLPGNINFEDMGALFFDADGDGDDDLYVVSGGTGLPPGNPFYTDRLFVNDGKGNFSWSQNALPHDDICGSQVTASDFDKDGDLDLFVCGRVDLEHYPMPAKSFLLRNESKNGRVIFKDVTPSAGFDLNRSGLLSAALWSDFNRDGWPDLILAGEWIPLTFYKNEKGHFADVTAATGLGLYSGWWNSLTGADFDRDGDIDYVAGNLGLNTRFKVSREHPVSIVAKDFDRNGTVDPVCSFYVQGKSYPIYHRNLMISQLPYLRRKFKTYESYAKAAMQDIFSEEELAGAYQARCTFFQTACIENNGDGTYEICPLPVEAQFAPVYGILADDFNADGNTDLLLTGNSYSFNVEDGQSDALTGLYLEGDGHGGFNAVPGRESGFFVDGDAKGLAELAMKNGNRLVLAAQNSGPLKVFETGVNGDRVIRLERDDFWAELKYESGKMERREFYYGSGYLSNSSRVCRVPEGVVSILVHKYSGETRQVSAVQKQ